MTWIRCLIRVDYPYPPIAARELQKPPRSRKHLYRRIFSPLLSWNLCPRGGPEDPTNQPSRVRGWLGWGMSGLWGFLGYTSSASMGPIILPEPPSQVEIAELYKALGLQPMQSGDNRQPQPAPLLASLRIEVSRVQATVRDECGSAKEISMTDLNVDNWCIPSGSAETIVSRRELAAGTKRARSFPAVFIAFHSSSGSPKSGKDPFLRIRLDPLKITVRPELIKRLASLTDGFPTSTLSAWIARCISLLRMLAKAQHVAYSQSTLRTEIELHSCLIHLPCDPDGELLDLAAEIELLQLVSNPVEDAMDSVKVLREIEHGHTLQTDGGMGSENVESVLFDDLERRLLYQRWAVTVVLN
ncbi:hypothetical protein BSKO_11673 [Bryopsis sp. KO-2023]|nr:hypothetical protein BSKO_11673 [Bryopsis sp. KO-2023]